MQGQKKGKRFDARWGYHAGAKKKIKKEKKDGRRARGWLEIVGGQAEKVAAIEGEKK